MSESAPPIPVAVVGLGWAAREIWLPRLRRHPRFTVAAVVDPVTEARARVAELAPGARAVASIEDIDPAEARFVVVAVPNHLHAAIGVGLLERGHTVFIEKPVCLSSEEARRLVEAEAAGGGVLLAGSAARGRADVRALYEAVRGLGAIRHIDASWVRSRGVPGAGGWFTNGELAGGGALLDLGWHLLDVVGPLTGDADAEQVVGAVSADFLADARAAAGWRGDTDTGLAAGVDVEDTARGFLVYDNRISLALRASWASHEEFDTTTVTVEGTAGTATLRCTFGFSPRRSGGSRLLLTRSGETTAVPFAEEPIGTEYDRQLDDIADRLAAPDSKGRAAREARRTVGVIERLYRSAGSPRHSAEPAAATRVTR
ncbi:Gfo/Idh/MocA family oxidoreductase [Streptomyces sp. NPDC051597]|uniref:Gfo/Idh/MocA family protein n=1 Tax=Streptomyces sp. NPDC051597 TaxID=3155049 RepID=UPI003433F210